MWLICLVLFFNGEMANSEVRWSRQVFGTGLPVTRERRQFSTGDWIPLTQPCITCRPLTDSADTGKSKIDDIGLVPPRPPTVTRQVHQSNFFPGPANDDAAPLLQAPPPPAFSGLRHPGSSSLSHSFLPQINDGLAQFQRQNIFQQTPHQFVSQPFIADQQFLLNTNQPYLFTQQPNFVLDGQGISNQGITQPPQNPKPTESQASDNKKTEEKKQEPKNVQLEQNAPLEQSIPNQFDDLSHSVPHLGFQLNSPVSFLPQPEPLIQLSPANQFLTPQGHNSTVDLPQIPDIHIPGLEKEEIQLLYVPVETLKQRGHYLQQLSPPPQKPKPANQQQAYRTLPQNTPFNNQANPQQSNNFNHQQTTVPGQFTLVASTSQPQHGHFVTHSTPVPSQHQHVTSTPAPPPKQPTIQSHLPQQITLQPSGVNDQVVQIHPRPLQQVNHQLINQQLIQNTVEQSKLPQPSPTPSYIFNQHTIPSSHQQIQLNHQQQQLNQQKAIQNPQFPERPKFSPQPTPEATTNLPTTTLAPHQPPLSVYMDVENGDGKVFDVLRALKDAKTIAVLDNFSKTSPRVFVGPSHLVPPQGFIKFELPYLSNIESNRVERKVERLPFFVAPLNFKPPPGYSKIPFPAPHVGSVVVASESAMRAALLHDKANPSASPAPDLKLPTNLPDLNPELPGLINDLEISKQKNEIRQETTPPPEATTYVRQLNKRPRRPNNVYRPPGRRPIPNAKLRLSNKPQPTETEQSFEDIKRETTEASVSRQTTHYQFPKRGSLSRRQRLKSTTEATNNENYEQTESSAPEVSSQRYQDHTERTDTNENRDNRFSDLSNHNQDQGNQNAFASYNNFEANQNTQPEVQGLFEVHQPNQFEVANYGNSGYQHPDAENQYFSSSVATEQPISSTRFFEHTVQQFQSTTPSEEPTEVSTSTQNPRLTKYTASFQKPREDQPQENTETEEALRQTSRVPNVPGVKSYPNPSSVKVKGAIRSRNRGQVNYFSRHSTTNSPVTRDSNQINDENDEQNQRLTEGEDEIVIQQFEVTKTTEEESSTPGRVKNKKYDHFNRSRKPFVRTSTPPPTTSTSRTSTYTVRPLRRTTTDRYTKRTRRPITPPPEYSTSQGYVTADPTYGRKSHSNYSPSGVSNEVYDEPQARASLQRYEHKPRDRTPQKNEDETVTVTPEPSSTKSFQTRRDEFNQPDFTSEGRDDAATSQNKVEEHSEKYPDWNPGASNKDISDIEFTTTAPSGDDNLDITEEKKKNSDSKKAVDPDSEKKSARRRIRVRVHKRPHDNFETAESQNVGTVSNMLVPPTPSKPSSEPDLYQFSKTLDGFDFGKTDKFIGTKNAEHVRNITSQILENTVSFSAPGVEETETVDLNKITIANETNSQEEIDDDHVVTTDNPSFTSPEIEVDESKDGDQTTTERYFEETTETTEIDTVSPVDEVIITTTTTPLPTATVSVDKVIKTSTTTQVSHETEICYKGKCIKTSPENSERDLKLLVSENISSRS